MPTYVSSKKQWQTHVNEWKAKPGNRRLWERLRARRQLPI